MPNDLSSPLAAIIAQAAALPSTTGETAKHQAILDNRADRLRNGGQNTVILADCSGSMDSLAGARRRIDILQDALDTVLPSVLNSRLVAFHSLPAEVVRRPQPGGSIGRRGRVLPSQQMAEANRQFIQSF